MSSQVRPHHLTEGSALDRRRIAELFYWAAKRLSAVDPNMISSNVITRDLLEESALEEMYFGDVTGVTYKTPDWTGFVLGITIQNDDNDNELAIDYSVVIEAEDTDCMWAYSAAIAGGKVLHESGHLLHVDQEFCYISPDEPPTTTPSGLSITQNDKTTMSGTATFSGESGTQHVGVLIIADKSFSVTRCSCSARRIVR